MKKFLLIAVAVLILAGILPMLLCGPADDQSTTVPWKEDLPTSFAKGRLKILPREAEGSRSWNVVFPQFRDVYFGGHYHRDILGPFKVVKKEAFNSRFFWKKIYWLTFQIHDTSGTAEDDKSGVKNNYSVRLKFKDKLERDRVNTWIEKSGRPGKLDITGLFSDGSCYSLVNMPKMDSRNTTLIDCSL